MEKSINRTTRSVNVLTLLSLLLALSGMAAIASADENIPIPYAPITLSGNVWHNGGWAENGTIIDAYVGGEHISSSHEVDQWSRYYMDINGSGLEEGETITFEVDGVAADETATWSESTLPTSQTLELNIGGMRDPDSTPPEPSSTDGGSNGGSGTSGGYASSTTTANGTGTQPVSGETATSATSTPTITETSTSAATSAEESGAESGEKKGLLPGFEAVFTIAGLLAVAYLLRRG